MSGRVTHRDVRIALGAMVLCGWLAGTASATVEYIEHIVTNQVYGEAGGVTMREPDVPRDNETVDIWIRIGYSFYYNQVRIYYTTDGSTPSGSFGSPSGSTQVLTPSFVRNEPTNIDWWKGTLPSGTRPYGTNVKYKISAWHSGGGAEIFANNYGCSDNVCNDPANPHTTFSYTVKMAWPGAGYGAGSPGAGYPSVHLWKEEAVTGNNYMNVMIDQNGTLYDLYFPSAGCVQGVGTKNEGYVDGLDTFPPGLPAGSRGQMHVNQAMAGLRVDGTTYWISNSVGDAYDQHSQSYVTDTNVISSSSRFVKASSNITVQQYDFCPKGITYPTTSGSEPVRGIYIKRYVMTNNGASSKTVDFYYYADPAINGGGSYDVMSTDAARGAMIAYDNTDRYTNVSGEYNPTSFSNYHKDVSVYFGVALKHCSSVGSSGGTVGTDFWRDTSSDNTEGWVGKRITIAAGASQEVDIAIVGGFDDFAGASGTYNYWVAPALDWFHSTSMSSVQSSTEAYWTGWLANGVTIDFPDNSYDSLFKRSLLTTALHVDGENGGVIAGMHNGAYPFVWPRDALYAAVTLDRTGHTTEAENVFDFLKNTAYRDNDTWGKGFWYQKYTTDGYQVWNAPQVDETANVTWAGWYHYLTTGTLSFLSSNYTMFYEAGRAMSEDSSINPSQLYYNDPVKLMYSNNVWEDSYDNFLYSNATVHRGLVDAANIATATGNGGDATLFSGRAANILQGLNDRLDWDGENTDISQLGLVWPFETHTADSARMTHVIARMNGSATDAFSNNHPLTNTGEFAGLINRYWGDTYWNGGPWFLSTLWYGQYYAQLQDTTPGKSHIDTFKAKIDLAQDFLGPVGLGAEQMAPSSSLLYAGQTDFRLQAAWPNAWESMSFIADSMMLFLDHTPDAPNNTLYIEPKLPTGWTTMTFENIAVGSRRIDVTVSENTGTSTNTHSFTNVTGGSLTYDTIVRIPASMSVSSATQNGSPIAYTYDGPSRVHITGSLSTGVSSITNVVVVYAAAPAPQVTAWKAVRVHDPDGSAGGPYSIESTLHAVNDNSECRKGGIQQIIADFNTEVAAVDGSLGTNDVTVSGYDGVSNTPYTPTSVTLSNGNTRLTINFTPASPGGDSPLPNLSRYTIDLAGKFRNTAFVNITGDTTVVIRSLVGDVNDSGAANLTDVAAVKNNNRAALSVSTADYDVNCDGRINLIDAALTRARHNDSAP